MGEEKINKNKFKNIIELGRLRFLLGGFLLYIMGSLLAVVSGVDFSLNLFLFGYAIMLPAHLGLSYSNNYFDVEVDKFNKPNAVSGGTKILIENPNLKKTSLYIAIGLMILSLVLAAVFIFIYSFSFWFFFFILFGNLLGFFYTAPPIRLAYNGLGEIANMINVGLLMPGIGYWIMKGSFDVFFFVFAIALFIYGLEFMIIVEYPDVEGDKIGKKNTLMVKIGRKIGYILILTTLVVSSIYFLSIYLLGYFSENINYFIIFLISLIPILVAIKGWITKPFDKEKASKVSTANLMTLSLFWILINIYFFISIIWS